MQQLFRYEDGFWPNLLAIVYACAAYLLGLYGILQEHLVLNLFAALLLAHAMVIAAYLVHECAHNTLFKKNRYHQWLGEVLLWIVGDSYSNYEEIRVKHVKHHTERADIVAFDYREKLKNSPRLLKLIQTLEWFYIPAVELLMHLWVLVLPFTLESRKHNRKRIIIALLARVTFFAFLITLSPRVLIFYPLAYLLFLHVMHFMDVHQHTYEVYETLDSPNKGKRNKPDRDYEQRNTYSNLLSEKHPWINLLVLNFCYHNVHHHQPGSPWYRLPEIHRELFYEEQRQVLPFSNLLKSYHQYRVERVLNADPSDLDVQHDKGRSFVGVDGVSFLTAH